MTKQDWNNLLLSYYNYIKHSFFCYCKDRSLSEDLTHDLWIVLQDRTHLYEDRGHDFKTWLDSVIRRWFYKYKYGHWKTQPTDLSEDIELFHHLVSNVNIERDYQYTEAIDALNKYVLESQSQALLLRVEGYSLEETAVKLGTSVAGIAKRQIRARLQLKKIYQTQNLVYGDQ